MPGNGFKDLTGQRFGRLVVIERDFNYVYDHNIKNEYALSHNIPLVRIPYWKRNSITLETIMGDQYLIKNE